MIQISGNNGAQTMQTLFQDIRFGCRMLVRNPGFTLAALICLGLGIGATTSVFSVLNAVVLRPLPYKDPDRLVLFQTSIPGTNMQLTSNSYPNYLDWQKQ